VRRTQLYLDEDLWKVLQVRSRQEKTTVSELVRQAVRDRYLSKAEVRKAAMTAIIGMWKDREDIGDSTEYVRQLRKDRRSESPWARKRAK
jgi:metal-responsive CopG/Arc/MetJ family transcriptional regulator